MLPLTAVADELTVFGTIDLAVTHLSNGGGSTNSMSHSGGNISRIGFRGTESLGSGYGARDSGSSRAWTPRAALPAGRPAISGIGAPMSV